MDGSVTLTIIIKTVATDKRDTFESSVNFGQRILKKVKSEMRSEITFTDEVPLRTLVHGRGVGGVQAHRALQRVHQLLYPGALVAVTLTSST